MARLVRLHLRLDGAHRGGREARPTGASRGFAPATHGERDPHYVTSIERLSATRLRPEVARAHLVYGEWLRREGRRVDAREQLRTAHSMFTDLGAESFAERARDELLATGATVRKRAEAQHEELTPQEAHVARLAADGRTNAEIGATLYLSPRTVEWHLKKV